jgi:hypothetical protein
MPYKLRFVQKFILAETDAFNAIEKQFAEFENQYPEFPKGRRYNPLVGKEPSNTLIWECDFDTLKDLQKAHHFLMNDTRHEDLFKEQTKFMLDAYTEIYKPFDA